MVLDVEGIAADGALRECCVFVVPQASIIQQPCCICNVHKCDVLVSARWPASDYAMIGAVKLMFDSHPCPFMRSSCMAQGRETEWIFSHPDGQWAVARDCLSRRVILVVLNRGHDFIASKAVQTELSPLVGVPPPATLFAEICLIPSFTSGQSRGVMRLD